VVASARRRWNEEVIVSTEVMWHVALTGVVYAVDLVVFIDLFAAKNSRTGALVARNALTEKKPNRT
jgi:hypothetical protein